MLAVFPKHGGQHERSNFSGAWHEKLLQVTTGRRGTRFFWTGVRGAEGLPGLTARPPSAHGLEKMDDEPSDTLINSSWNVVELSQSVPNFVESDRSHYLLQTRSPSLTRTCCIGREEPPSIVVAFTLQVHRGTLFFDVPIKREWLALVRAQVKALESRRNHGLMSSGRDALHQTFSFSDAHAVAKSITNNFALFYETLIKLDTQGTGRISLAKVYAVSSIFAESEDYFRTQGVLDSASSSEPQVIIPNYLQAASNRIVATAQYHMCCPNHGGRLLGGVGGCCPCRLNDGG